MGVKLSLSFRDDGWVRCFPSLYSPSAWEAMPGHVRPCQVMSDHVRSCQIMSGHIRPCQVMSLCHIISDYVRPYQAKLDHARLLLDHVRPNKITPCQVMSDHVRSFQTMSDHVTMSHHIDHVRPYQAILDKVRPNKITPCQIMSVQGWDKSNLIRPISRSPSSSLEPRSFTNRVESSLN